MERQPVFLNRQARKGRKENLLNFAFLAYFVVSAFVKDNKGFLCAA